ncbi:hypothetical protein AX17_001299 [Amanita inopinata Kibby_2008]|nr:hypothetical protein AX17_001299 [Amanita inopinata Kibby_2008]
MDNLFNEENTDLETLQSQINMSMSFAQGLVSSWIEPNKVVTTSRGRDLEKELQEYMRRPPRLGVGAPIPETQNLSRETARLKGQLRDKAKSKRTQEESQKSSDSEHDEESKAKVIKKRARLDPFNSLGSRKKKPARFNHIPPLPVVVTNERDSDDAEMKEPTTVAARSDAFSTGFLSQRVGIASTSPKTGSQMAEKQPKSVSPVTGLDHVNDLHGALKCGRTHEKGGMNVLDSQFSTKADSRSAVVPTVQTTELSASLLKCPVLNLDGPPLSEGDEDQTLAGTSEVNRKKKRRKRKKRNRTQELQLQ